jgi:CHRD domain
MLTTRRIWIPLMTAVLALAAGSVRAEELRFLAKLTGAAQLPEPTKTKATGEVKLTVHDGGKKISYTLTVTDLENATTAELHLGGANMNGPAVVRLFPAHGATARKGAFSGVLADGTITSADLLGPLLGSGLGDLVDQLRDGNAYVNIHTNDGMDPPESGPGDYRKGEIRGQIEAE